MEVHENLIINIKEEKEVHIIDIKEDPLAFDSSIKQELESDIHNVIIFKDQFYPSPVSSTKNEEIFSCEVCSISLPSQSYYDRHLKTKGHFKNAKKKKIVVIPVQKPLPPPTPVLTVKASEFHCDPCKKTFSKQCHYTQHVKSIHSGIKNFKCIKCGKKFETQPELNYHASKHDRLKPFKCLQCSASYNTKFDLNRHELNHNKKNIPHSCELCGKRFVRRDHLLKHYRSHEKKNQVKIVKNEVL